jgi:hypothetical protein
MKKLLKLAASAIVGLAPAAILATASASAAPTCTPTGFMRDSINLTAAQIGGNVTGTLNATGCNIGVYYNSSHTGNVSHANIFGANYFGVVVDGGSGNVKVNVSQSSIHNIGDVSFDGDQHGNAIYYYGYGTPGHVSGTVSQNQVSQYQKGGIIVNGSNANVTVQNNTVTGLGRVNFIAQNGIQLGYGASGNITQNTVTGNAYTGANNASSCGILIYGGYGVPLVINVTIAQDTLSGNDIGVCAANYNAAGNAGPSSPTNININHNTISNDAVTNISGNGSSQGYQAGISDSGKRDSITYNQISGAGYAPENTATEFIAPIDISAPYSINPIVSHNLYNGHTYTP